MTFLENFKNELGKLRSVKESCESCGLLDEVDFQVNFLAGEQTQFGEAASNLVLILAKKVKREIKELGLEILKEIEEEIKHSRELGKIVNKVELAKNGFLNFTLRQEFLIEQLESVSNLENIYTKYSSEKVLVEHSSPNLFKPFHLGHLMNNLIGESLVQMMRSTNADLRVVSFPSDVSIGIAKAIFILKSKTDWSFADKDIILKFGQAYVDGLKYYDEHTESQSRIREITKNLFEKNESSEEYKLFKRAREINVKYFKQVLGELGTQIDEIIYESDAGIEGEKIIKEDLNKELKEQVFTLGEGGAIYYDTKKVKNKKSTETIKSIFINSEGHPTYEAKDLGLLKLKFDYFDFAYSFFVTDNEQIPHFEIVLEVGQKLGGVLREASLRSRHIPHGRLNLAGGARMSSRLGNVLGITEVLESVYEKTREKMRENTKDLSEKERESIVKKVSLAALKIAILKSRPGLDINFDFTISLNFEGSTGPYLLYTYARASSLMEKGGELKEGEVRVTEENRKLVLTLIQMEDVLRVGIENLSPQVIVKYLFDLAQAFNSFYGAVKILSEDGAATENNLNLVRNFRKVFKFTLNTLGIEEVDKM